MVRYLRMFRAFAATEFQFEMEYRGNFYLSIFEMFLVIGTSIGAVLIMFGHTTTMNGWTLPEMIVLLGVYYLIQGGVNLVFSPSFERLMEHVRVGTLDFHLLKPVNVQFLVSTRHLRVVRAADLLLGLVVVIVGLLQVGAQIGVAQSLLLLGLHRGRALPGRCLSAVAARIAQHHRSDRHRGHGTRQRDRRTHGRRRRRAPGCGHRARGRHRQRAVAPRSSELYRRERLIRARFVIRPATG
ncbi:MAG: hypothetical protein E6J35_05470 [Chloroflexi bacterium]|nr:MAG: hypothetical protein E6J35_05470 [Chloroflexota bacterium]